MKKFIFGIVCAFALTMGFTACNNATSTTDATAAPETETVDSLDVDVEVAVADTLAVDTLEVAE